MTKTLAVIVLAVVVCGCSPPPAEAPAAVPAPAFPAGELVDLSHSYDAQTIFWPTSEPFRLETVSNGQTPAGYFYAANNFSMAEHGGTHIDAPVHFGSGKLTVDHIPLDRLIGATVVVEVVSQAEGNADYLVTAEDLQAWEKEHGRIPQDAILLIRTGYSSRWPDAARYLGTAERGPAAVALLHFPGLHPDATRWLIANRAVKALGIDTASIDYGQSTMFETHRLLSENNIPAFENLTSLERLPPTGAHVVALPIKIGNGSGGPLRAIAILPNRN
jgi:kynurenine formamidase